MQKKNETNNKTRMKQITKQITKQMLLPLSYQQKAISYKTRDSNRIWTEEKEEKKIITFFFPHAVQT